MTARLAVRSGRSKDLGSSCCATNSPCFDDLDEVFDPNDRSTFGLDRGVTPLVVGAAVAHGATARAERCVGDGDLHEKLDSVPLVGEGRVNAEQPASSCDRSSLSTKCGKWATTRAASTPRRRRMSARRPGAVGVVSSLSASTRMSHHRLEMCAADRYFEVDRQRQIGDGLLLGVTTFQHEQRLPVMRYANPIDPHSHIGRGTLQVRQRVGAHRSPRYVQPEVHVSRMVI